MLCCIIKSYLNIVPKTLNYRTNEDKGYSNYCAYFDVYKMMGRFLI